MKSTQEMIEVMQAAMEGKKVERQMLGCDVPWQEESPPLWNWFVFDYRVKPVEPRQLTAVRYPSVGFCFPSLQAQPGDGDTIEFIELTPEIKSKLGL